MLNIVKLALQTAALSVRGTVPCSCQFMNRSLYISAVQRGIFEPDGLDDPPEIPEYDDLNVRLRAYDFAMLESYSKYVNNLAVAMGIETECWAVPARTHHIQTYKPYSTAIDHEYDMAMCERTIQLIDLQSTLLPIFLEVAQKNMPAGIQMTVKEHDLEEEEFRFIPDLELRDLHAQVDAIEQAREERRNK